MEAWLEIVIRQLILYSLPVLISLTLVTLFEARLSGRPRPHPFYAVGWPGTWLPWISAIFFGRGVIISLPQPLQAGHRAASRRFFAHLLLCGAGFLLYSWSLNHQPPAGLPPLHHWWSKVLMFFNLCMAAMHLLPLPGQWLGEWLLHSGFGKRAINAVGRYQIIIYTVLAASPLLDWFPGSVIVFPVYEQFANLASGW